MPSEPSRERPARPGFPRAFIRFLWDYKFWWLLPIALVLALFLALIVAGGGNLTPFIYDHS